MKKIGIALTGIAAVIAILTAIGVAEELRNQKNQQ